MEFQDLLKLLLVLGGLFLAIRSTYIFKSANAVFVAVILVSGVSLSGVGAYGLVFMDKYREVLDSLTAMVESGDAESYALFISEVAEGDMPDDAARVGLDFAVNNPLPDTEQVLEAAIARAETGPARMLLTSARDELAGKQRAAEAMAVTTAERGDLTPQFLRRFDSATARNMVRSIERMSPARRQQLGIDGQVFSALRDSF